MTRMQMEWSEVLIHAMQSNIQALRRDPMPSPHHPIQGYDIGRLLVDSLRGAHTVVMRGESLRPVALRRPRFIRPWLVKYFVLAG